MPDHLWTRSSPIEAFGATEAAVINPALAAAAEKEISSWSHYQPSPLYSLGELARACEVRAIDYKDEGNRFNLGSFKALGGAYAVRSIAQRAQDGSGRGTTVACATDGNHGRSVAWAASRFGLSAAIYVHSEVSERRKSEIERYGARVHRVGGVYDDAVRQVKLDGERFGWTIVSDTSYPGYTEIPSIVMQGYTVMPAEAARQREELPTHVFLQCGVGALPAAICAYYRAIYGDAAPKIVVVEPDNAACLLASARAGTLTELRGDISTVMAGLACGRPSMLAWEILSRGAFGFMSVPDTEAVQAMRLLASGNTGAAPIVAGETGAVGLAGFQFANRYPEMRARLGIDRSSRIMVIGTESDTDPELYRRIMNLREDEVSSFCENRAWSRAGSS
ncbi:diaminopropionate ammonia-lyase [Bradyrhizobium rifense]|uniref:Diaminopropionate ammonia-lyase n=1 Tax=Bradyrhizobium rifense TaxID=515499 RepID=A0A5D3KDS4_9BRAD|nr:diaminopropionate ammonia-lyase [Bradyrhizobium rifense]TYL88447.1 diaminopropionate ammonia-lyase [Bradyrhizobium rifense]